MPRSLKPCDYFLHVSRTYTYTVDGQGRFATEHVIASTFPNWTGLSRDTSRITETVSGDTMVERLKDPGGPQIVILWKRAR